MLFVVLGSVMLWWCSRWNDTEVVVVLLVCCSTSGGDLGGVIKCSWWCDTARAWCDTAVVVEAAAVGAALLQQQQQQQRRRREVKFKQQLLRASPSSFLLDRISLFIGRTQKHRGRDENTGSGDFEFNQEHKVELV